MVQGYILQGQIKFIDVLKDFVFQAVDSIDNILGALLIAVIGFIIARIVQRVSRKVLVRIKVDNLGERLNEIELAQRTPIKIKPSLIISKSIYYLLLLLFFMAAAEVLGMETVSQLFTDIIEFIPDLIAALIILILGVLLAELVRKIVFTTAKSLNIPSAKFIASLVFYFIFINVAVMALAQARVDTAFIASNISVLIAGIVLAFAIGYGLASRGQMANYVASLYTKDRFQVGDIIEVEGTRGEIVGIDRTYVTIRTGDGRVMFPISKLTSEKVEIFDS